LNFSKVQPAQPRGLQAAEDELVAALVAVVGEGVGEDGLFVGRGVQAVLFAGEDGHQGVGRVVDDLGVFAGHGDEHAAARRLGGRVGGEVFQDVLHGVARVGFGVGQPSTSQARR
jgi:hypothetical protein